jgi:hypothetical protein
MWKDIPWNPTRRTLRRFAMLWFLFFALLAIYQAAVRHENAFTPALAFCVLGVLLGPFGIAWPGLFRPLFVGSMVAAFPLNYVTSRLVLALIFYGMFMPLGLLFRLVGRDPLGCRSHPEQRSYWLAKPGAAGPQSYLRQF